MAVSFLPMVSVVSAKQAVRSAAERGWGRCWASNEVGNPKWGLSRAGRFTPRTFTPCLGWQGAGRLSPRCLKGAHSQAAEGAAGVECSAGPGGGDGW